MTRHRHTVTSVTPASLGLTVGDLVVYKSEGWASIKASTGGVIYQIVEDTPPVVPAKTVRMIAATGQRYDGATNMWVDRTGLMEEYGEWDSSGKKIMASALNGFIRISPLFTFFPTVKGKEPKGKGKSIIIEYCNLELIKKVTVEELGCKYVELGELMKLLMRKGGGL